MPTASTALTIWANRLAKPLVDRYLARTNSEAQQTDTPASADDPDNLLEPQDQDRDRGSHGPFDDQAHQISQLQVLSRNRGKVRRCNRVRGHPRPRPSRGGGVRCR
ncbi:MAG: hypothetical protein KY462_13935 [Actinobacteria bacterium]|nr:hypothetical protein [Actinomycetota bacterium]